MMYDVFSMFLITVVWLVKTNGTQNNFFITVGNNEAYVIIAINRSVMIKFVCPQIYKWSITN